MGHRFCRGMPGSPVSCAPHCQNYWGKGGYGGKPWKVSLCSWAARPERRRAPSIHSCGYRHGPSGCVALSSIATAGARGPAPASENTMRTRAPMPTVLTRSGGQLAVGRDEVADNAQGLVGGRLALLVSRRPAGSSRASGPRTPAGWRDHLRVGVHGPSPSTSTIRPRARSPGAGGGGRIAQQLAVAAPPQVETVRGAALKYVTFSPSRPRAGAHSRQPAMTDTVLVFPAEPRRMTMADP